MTLMSYDPLQKDLIIHLIVASDSVTCQKIFQISRELSYITVLIIRSWFKRAKVYVDKRD